MAVRTAGQLRPVNSTICITPYCFLCNRITCLRRSCSSARLCLRASSSLIGKVMNCVATTIKISLGRVYKQRGDGGEVQRILEQRLEDDKPGLSAEQIPMLIARNRAGAHIDAVLPDR